MASAGGWRQAAAQAAGTLPGIAQPVALAPSAAKLVLAVATATDDDAGPAVSPHAAGHANRFRAAAPAPQARLPIVLRILRPFAQGPPAPAV